MKPYIPRKGDFVSLNFDPQSGHEQRGRRPALVVSNTLFNERTGLAMVCPLTNTDRRFPFHVPIRNDPKLTGFVMVEQVKSIDFLARKAARLGKASEGLLEEVLSLLDACIY
jgi:mRNA interferase MazF